MKSRTTFLVCLFAAFAVLLSGCATLDQITHPSTQPVTAAQRITAMQSDLLTTDKILNLAHDGGAFNKPGQWTAIQTQEASAQSAINAASEVLTTGGDVNSMLDVADAALKAFKAAKGT